MLLNSALSLAGLFVYPRDSAMPKTKPGYYFFVVCVKCGEEIILRDAPSRKDKELALTVERSTLITRAR